MSFLLNENNGGAAGRRRVSQVSNDEWRAALQQQIEEKQLREQQQKRYRGYEDEHKQQQQQIPQMSHYGYQDPGFDNSDSNNHAWDMDNQQPNQQYQQQLDQSSMVRPGRRNVQEMSNDAWREALEQQIREKKEREQQEKQQDNEGSGAEASRRRGQSAPGQDQEGSFLEIQAQQDHERAMTTPLPSNNASTHQVQHGRRRVGIQTQEEYLKSLQDQLEMQKRFEQEALEFKKAQRQLRRKILTDDEPTHKEVVVPVSIPATPVAKAVDPVVAYLQLAGSDSQQPKSVDAIVSESKQINDEGSIRSSVMNNQAEAEVDSSSQSKASEKTNPDVMEGVIVPAAVVAADPVALAKIVDFCEELKRQNEEVKQQLVEQHSVLASLRSTLADAKTQVPGDKAPSTTSAKSSSRMKKLKQAASGVPQRRIMATSAPADEKKSKKKTHTEHLENKRAENTMAKAADAGVRPPVVRARPIRGESKIPFPSGIASAAQGTGSLEAKATHGVADPKVASEEVRDETTVEVLKKTTPSEEDSTVEAKDARHDEPAEGCKMKAISEDDDQDGTDGAKSITWDAKSELWDEDDQQAPAKSHQTVEHEDEDDGDLSEAKAHGKVREHKLDLEEEADCDGDKDELTIIHSDSYLIVDDEVELLAEDELPLSGESKLLRCETSQARDGDDGEIRSCSSFVLVDGASSLVSLDQSLGEVFRP